MKQNIYSNATSDWTLYYDDDDENNYFYFLYEALKISDDERILTVINLFHIITLNSW